MRGLPMTQKEIAQGAREDNTLRQVANYIQRGWPAKMENGKIKPFWLKRAMLAMFKGCILWENRVVVPKKFQVLVLEILHTRHYGRDQDKGVVPRHGCCHRQNGKRM